jgi:NADPH2:quinone reductase
MRAVVCHELGPPEGLVLRELDAPLPAPGQIVLAVHAASVNFPDLLMVQGRYQARPPLPFTPGSEAAGTVVRVGAGVAHLAVGERALATMRSGAFAEEVACDASRAYRVPDGVGFEAASALLYTYGTALHALVDRAALVAGETLVVLGAGGGVGLAAVELGALLGARVVAAASSDEKLAACRARGASEHIRYDREDLKERIKALTGGRGADVVLDPVGGPYTEPALRATAPGGRHLVVGFAAGEIPRIPLNLVLLKSSALVGVFLSALAEAGSERHRDNAERLVGWLAAGKLRPHVSARYPLEEAARALADMAARRIVGKAIVSVRPVA